MLVHKTALANHGDIVIAVVDDTATMKELIKLSDDVILSPKNKNMAAIKVQKESLVINGVVEAIIKTERKFRC